MKLLHLADCHLGASYSAFGGLAAERRREVLDAFRRLPDIATEERVDAVLFAGDVFDGPRAEGETMAAVRETLRRLVDACIPVFMVPGNHDAVTLKLNPYRELARASRVRVVDETEGDQRRAWPVGDERGRRLAEKHAAYIIARPRFAEPVTVETESGPLHVYGVAYDRAECDDPLATFQRAEAPGIHVALLHAAVHDAPHWRGSGNSLVTAPEALELLRVDYVALGDHHRPRSPDEFDGVPACYPGSFAALDLTEAGPRGFALVELSPGHQPRVRHLDSGVTPVELHEMDVSGCEDDVQVAERAARMVAAGAVPVIRLVGEPGYPLDADVVATELRERFGHAHVTDETRFYDAERLAELAEHDTVAGHVVRLGRRRIEESTEDADRAIAERALRVALRALGVD